MLYSGVASRFSPPQPQQEVAVQETPSIVESPSEIEPMYQQTIATQDVMVTNFSEMPGEILQSEDLSLSVTSTGTGIKEVDAISYETTLAQTNIGLLVDWQSKQFNKYDISNGMAMSYVDEARGLEIRKTYRFTKNRYIVEMDVEFINTSDAINNVQYSMNIASMSQEVIQNNPINQRYLEFSASLPSKIVRGNLLRFNPKTIEEDIQWVGIRDRYFCVILRPLQAVGGVIKSKDDEATSYLLQVPQFTLAPGGRIKHAYLMYIGPQKPDLIKNLGADAQNIINFGIFDALSHILLSALKGLYKLSKNWGVTIILFSLLAFLVMSPLSIKSFKSMKRMQEMQPLIEELKAKYKDSPQKMNKEVMELYREKKINPLGGCLPMFLQMPVFIALYQTLMRFIDLKGASFLWIKDLSEPDRLFVFKSSLPIVGNELNVLPLIMIVTMLLQQKLTSAKQPKAAGQGAQQQKMMSLFMAVFFGIIFYHMPAGLVLYWSVNSISMLVFQVKVIGKPVAKTE